MPLCLLQAQDVELSNYYHQQLEKREFSLAEKEKLVDSLLLQKNIQVDPLKLVKIYRDFINVAGFSNIKKAVFYAQKVENIAVILDNFNINDFKKNRRNRIVFLHRDQQFYKALKAANNYLERYPEVNNSTSKIYRSLGNIYGDLGDFQKAITIYDKSIYLSKSFQNDEELVRTYVCKLQILVDLYETSYSKQILKIKKELEKLTNHISVENKIVTYLNLGAFYDFIEDFTSAKENYVSALNISTLENDTINIFRSNINLAIVSKKTNQLEKAKYFLEKANENSSEDGNMKAMVSNNLADIYQKENNHQKALIHYQKAIVLALESKDIDYQQLPTLQDIEFSPNKIDVLGYLIDKANGWIAYYDAEGNPEYLKNALDTFTLADQLIDLIYVESREDLSKLFWRKKGATFYPKAVEVCYRLQQPEKAFFFMEKNKAMLLLENMTNATAKRLSKLPENILEREQNLIKEIKTFESEIQAYETTETQTIDSLKNSVFKYKKEYAAFIDSLETEFPKYYNYKKNINIVTLQNVQSTLQADELILQYIVGKEKGFVALISPKSIQLKELPTTEILTETVTQYKEAVSKPFVKNEDKNKYEALAKKLYQQLIPFNTSEMQFAEKRITIIADGLLQYIPFEALRTPNNAYFIENTEIHYNYSLSSAAQSQQNNTPISKAFIAIAPTKFKNDQFGALATSKEELEKLTNIFNANHFQYEEATKELFTEAYGNYKIVHLSTHGGINNTVPWMAFYDEKITLDELYFTKNKSELVVLSACKTSDGELKKGEGVMSLARGFFNAGAKSVVSSLWDINEKASNDIIQEFYKNIAAGDTKSFALQKAKLTYLKNNKNTSEASPYYWSALTITGDINPIYNNKNVYLYYIIGGLFLTGIILWIRSKRRKQQAA
ncbi:CHAT domain-containing protein [Kordia sp. YSTF-M3]|uniref:CHAT domain-containing protein n=1 Tax=Kordia aestuariivivens TaxID=2759037 RepID=A0ABR7QGA2_9FLAO|nr:CHAT domain-containing protein [Kordia aestuariivivens]MBC8757324.1 CHAT domain-containing protein [Kordia aestuariivivens]